MSISTCAVHGKPIDHYWMCEQFWTCADAMYDYVCHSVEECAESGCGPHGDVANR